MTLDRTFRSRVDLWLATVVLGAAALPLGMAIWTAMAADGRGTLLLAIWGVAMLTAIVALTFPMRYTLESECLRIQSGFLDWTISYRAMRHVRPTLNPLSGPAWSLRRIRIEYAPGDFILVSPDDRELFIEELALRCPHLVRNGPRLDPRPTTP